MGAMFDALAILPTAMQYAHGWTRLSVCLNVLKLIFMIPLMYWGALHFGAEGVAMCWVVMHVSFLLLSIHKMHGRIITDEKLRWLIEDVGMPLIASFSVIVIARWFFPKESINAVSTISILAVTYLITFCAALLASPHIRHRAKKNLIRARI